MEWLIVAIAVLGLLTAVGVKLADLLSRRSDKEFDVEDAVVTAGSDCSTCTGENSKCEQDCMLEAAVRDIEYFDDEELDVYARRPSCDYSDDEAEQFRQVFETMRQEPPAAWCRSLNLRGIELPDQVKDEVMLLREN